MFKWFIGDAYKFKEVVCASEMSFPDPCTFHARLNYEEQFMESCTSPPQSLKYAAPLCHSYLSSS